MTWRPEDPQGGEANKIKYEIVRYTRGRGLDLGCGPSKPFGHFIGVDDYTDTRLFGIGMRPDVCADVRDLSMFADASMDFVFSSHTLEHIEDAAAALTEWWRVIKEGGHLVLYLPHADLYPRMGTEGANPDHKHDFRPGDIMDLMVESALGWELLVSEDRAEGCEYSFLQVYRKQAGPAQVHRWMQAPRKRACVVRFGGYGDQLQAANVLPALKREGFHVTFMATPSGQDILRHDPHIDEFFILDRDQVPNAELGAFFAAQRRHYDRFINLCESVEGSLLAMPGRINHEWPQSARHQAMDLNYGEFTAALAGVPYASEGRFWATAEETQAAAERLKPGVFNVMMVLAGSSVHKFSPHMDALIARGLLELPAVQFFLVGDEACQILEIGWENEERVSRLSGKLSIRETLALALAVDCVIGPETGVLNAVAFEPMAKIVWLSHSSRENLTKHWTNTVALSGDVPCYPCHRLHYTRQYCPQQEEGGALCQWAIDPEAMVAALTLAHSAWAKETHREAA